MKVPLQETFSNQAKSVQQDLDNKIYEIVGELHKEGFQSERFDRVILLPRLVLFRLVLKLVKEL